MFPNANFIFILRHPGKVVRLLALFKSFGGGSNTEQEAYARWFRLVRPTAQGVVCRPAKGPVASLVAGIAERGRSFRILMLAAYGALYVRGGP